MYARLTSYINICIDDYMVYTYMHYILYGCNLSLGGETKALAEFLKRRFLK